MITEFTTTAKNTTFHCWISSLVTIKDTNRESTQTEQGGSFNPDFIKAFMDLFITG